MRWTPNSLLDKPQVGGYDKAPNNWIFTAIEVVLSHYLLTCIFIAFRSWGGSSIFLLKKLACLLQPNYDSECIQT